MSYKVSSRGVLLILRAFDNEIDINTVTLIQCMDNFFHQKRNLKSLTKVNYEVILSVLKKEEFYNLPLSKITTQKAKQWCVDTYTGGKGYSRISGIKAHTSSMYKQLIEDDVVRKNPFDFDLRMLIKRDVKKREALTNDEQRRFLNFVQTSIFDKYYDAIFLMLNTGLRIGEFVALTVSDINFENKLINVSNQLIYYNRELHVAPTKSISGNRHIPMTADVEETLKRVIENRPRYKKECTIDGKTEFLFLTNKGKPVRAMDWESRFRTIIKRYNSTHKDQLPQITPHVLRHTYCSNLIKSGMSVKTVQYLMGRSSVEMTLDVYTHITYEDVKNEFLRHTAD